MSNKSEQYVSSLLGAIDTVLSQRLTQLAYDKTIICTITDNSNAKNGVYQVSDGSVKFQAQSENTDYRINDQVRVQVPNGDMTQEKFILGRYTKDMAMTPITYLSPVDSVLKLSDNLITENKNVVYTLVANGDTTQVTIWDSNTLSKDNQALQSSQIYDTIYLEAEFKSLLSNYNLKAGNYGLVLELYPETPEGFAGAPIKCVLDCSDMLGNPYAFSLYTKQAATFDISNIARLHSMKLLFVQDQNFTSVNGTKIIPAKLADDTAVANLFLQNISLGFGSYLENVPNHTVKIFTTDSLFYDRDRETTFPINNDKTLNLIWYNKDADGTYIGWDDRNLASAGGGWADEQTYQDTSARNAQLAAMIDYNIPIDEAGLEIAANLPNMVKAVKSLSTMLSKDIYGVLFSSQNSLKARFPDNDTYITSFLNELESLLSVQTIDVYQEDDANQEDDVYHRYTAIELAEWLQQISMDIMNEAATYYNVDYIPSTLGSNWQFKWNTANPKPSWINCAHGYAALQNWIEKTRFYLYGSESIENPVFLSEPVRLRIESNHPGYQHVYDEFERRFRTILTSLGERVDTALQYFKTAGGEAYDHVLSEYGQHIRDYHVWESPTDSGASDNQYCIYWYKSAPEASGDSFMPAGWERLSWGDNNPANYKSESISILLDASYTTQTTIQAIVIFNHVCYKSNTITFTNNAPLLSDELANLADTIRIYHGENSQDLYANYNIANMLVDGSDRYRIRTLHVEYIYENGGVRNDYLQNAQIYWYVPTVSTMIEVDTEDLATLSINNFKEFDTGAYYRETYRCFYKLISSDEGIAMTDAQFAYRIKDYYSATATNNTIICKVVRDGASYEAEISLAFTSKGANGTGYTIAVSPATAQAALTPANTSDNPWNLHIRIYNNENKLITDAIELTTSLLMPSKRVILKNDSDNMKFADGVYTLPVYYQSDKTGPANCNVLNITCVMDGINLSTKFPIPFAASAQYFIDGASFVIYDESGGRPTYSKMPYHLYQQRSTVDPEAEWLLTYDPGYPDETVRQYLPRLASDDTLVPCTLWIKDGDMDCKSYTRFCPYVKAIIVGGDMSLWEQPIIIMQNRFASSVLNEWDGSFTIDEENGTILSTMVGAGYKGTDNSFYGVLMGDIAAGAQSVSGVGLYGYHAGAQSFGFNIDGTAFIGKSGNGRLIFDGNNATIADPEKRLLIDFNAGRIEGKNFTLSGEGEDEGVKTSFTLSNASPYFKVIRGDAILMEASDNQVLLESPDKNISLKLGSNSTFKLEAKNDKQTVIKLSNSSPYITVNTTSGANLFQASDSGVFLQDPSGEKVKISLTATDSSIVATNFTLSAASESGKVTISSVNASPINVNNKFIVNWDGSFSVNDKAFSVTADGALSANNGTVKIDTGGLTVTQGVLDLGKGKFHVDNDGNTTIQNGTITINDGAINLGLISDDPKRYAFSVDKDGKMVLLNRASSIEIGESEVDAGFPAIKIDPTDGLYMEKGKIRLGRIEGTDAKSDYTHYVTITESGFTLLHPNTLIQLGQSEVEAGDFAVQLSGDGLVMHQGEIKLGKVEGVKAYNVEISSTAIELGYDANATKGNSHFFSVTSAGKMTLYHSDSVIELGQSPHAAGDPAVKISSGGVIINQGKINLANQFIVTDTGAVAIGGALGSAVSVLVGTNGNLYLGGTSLVDGSSCTAGSWSAMLGANGLEIRKGDIQLGTQGQIHLYNTGSASFAGVVAIGGAIAAGTIPLICMSDGIYFNGTLVSDLSSVSKYSAKIGADGLEIKQGSIYLNQVTSDWGSNYSIEIDAKGIRCGSYLTGESGEDLGHNFSVDENGNVTMNGDLNIANALTFNTASGFLSLTNCQITLQNSETDTTDFSVTSNGKLRARSVNIENFLEIEGSLWVHNTEGSYVDIYAQEIWMGLDEGTSDLWIEAFSTIGSISPSGAKNLLKQYGLTADLYIASDVFTAGSFIFEDRILVADISDHVTYQGIDGTYKVETGWWSSKQLTFKKGILVAIDGKTQDETTGDVAPTKTLGSSTQPIYLSNGEFKTGEAYYKTSEVYTQSEVNALLISNSQQAARAFAPMSHRHTDYSVVGHGHASDYAPINHGHDYATPADIESLSQRISALAEYVGTIKSCTCTPNPTN